MGASPAAGRDPHVGQAPGDLATLQAFVNTLDVEAGTDELSTPAGLDSWLRDSGLTAGASAASGPRDLATAVELREAMRGVLRSHVNQRDERGVPATGSRASGRGSDRAGRRESRL